MTRTYSEAPTRRGDLGPHARSGRVGPDFSSCGLPVEWGDRQPMDDRFGDALVTAIESMGVDIELARWDDDSPLAGEFTKWWTMQRGAIRRELTLLKFPGLRPVVTRRTDSSDGYVKCYIRFDRQRPQAVAAA